MTPIIIYTDGSCKGNPGPGGWAAILTRGNEYLAVEGGEAHTTNNRMELTAVIEGIKHLFQVGKFEVRSDSRYVIDTINKGYQRRKNQDLWHELDLYTSTLDIIWTWIKGHNGDYYNEMADRIAQAEAEKWRLITTCTT
ncbi:hypothetical protein LCGC14_1610380 [marine sediment metagenome]|uniref:ribonuclease H n=1 Tax=marine sediment metagenome TaxID=412755 RepID=A0A0F9KP65_9ZZZZ